MKKLFLFLSLIAAPLFAETIDEKKERLKNQESNLSVDLTKELSENNKALAQLRNHLKECYESAEVLYQENAPAQEFQTIAQEIKKTRAKIVELEEKWQEEAEYSGLETHALWHQPQTTLLDLVTDYGSSFVYLLPADIASTNMSITSHLPIPTGSWDEMLELILSNSGFGIRQLNPYLRQVFALKEESLNLKAITNNQEDLLLLPNHSRVCFVLSTNASNQTTIYQFFLRFSNPNRMRLSLIGKDIFLIGEVKEIKELLDMYLLIDSAPSSKEYRLVPLTKMKPSEMAKILNAYFSKEKENTTLRPDDSPILGINILAIESQLPALFLVGTKEQLGEAERLIAEVESNAQDPKEKIIFCYTCKHTQPEELANVLQHVYSLMGGHESIQETTGSATTQENTLIVQPKVAEPAKGSDAKSKNTQMGSFVVDSKCGSIVMVVEKEHLCAIKELLKKLDVPKKMVLIEVLLFEKKVTEEDHFGLNLLKIGSNASQSSQTSFGWNDAAVHSSQGILSFFLSRTRQGCIPAFDLGLNFLLSQEDVQINACPSVTTMNQTPAKIALVEETSLNNGAVIVDGENVLPFMKDSYSRAQYGITIEITPTIHQDDALLAQPYDQYITLDTDITFDTIKPSKVNRPDVTRRNIKNQVRIPNGQTVILGGLRRKTSHDNKEMIPFLGEIPGFGKLFSETKLSDSQTEMFIFLTPRIIEDTNDSLKHITHEELCRRPGDIPEYLQCLQEGRQCEWQRLFSGTLKLLFGRDEISCN